jgi:cytochrome c1
MRLRTHHLLPLLLLLGCDEGQVVPTSQRVAGGDPERGRSVLADYRYGCGSCHSIPGVKGARGTVGPPLHGMGVRAYVAGRLPNEPGNLVAWILNPRRFDPESAMPATGITEAEAQDVAAYLYTLREVPR